MTTLIDNSEDKPTITVSPNRNGNMKEIMFRHLGTVDDLGKRKLSYEKAIVLGLSPIVVGGAIWCSFKFGSAWTPNFFRELFDNLPLALPILTLLLSVLLSPQSVITRQGALRLSNPISLGLVNFAIWYLVTAQSANKFIKVNDHSVLNADYAVLVFIVAFMFAGFCSV